MNVRPRDGETYVEVRSGGAGEFGDDRFYIVLNWYEEYQDESTQPCRHATDIGREEHEMRGGAKYYKKCWRLPVAVLAFNEGGYDYTSVCLMCAVEAAERVGAHVRKP